LCSVLARNRRAFKELPVAYAYTLFGTPLAPTSSEVIVMRAFTNGKRSFVLSIVMALFIVGVPSASFAQDETRPNIVLDVMKSVVLDPTTYAPATLSYTSQRMDWNSSQVLFKAGWLEHNSRYTVSGRADDTPIGYDAGLRQIRGDALLHLQESLVNNLSAQIFERALTQKYPQRRKLFKTLSWIERISFSSYVGYLASVNHFRQVQKNQEMARQYGIQ